LCSIGKPPPLTRRDGPCGSEKGQGKCGKETQGLLWPYKGKRKGKKTIISGRVFESTQEGGFASERGKKQKEMGKKGLEYEKTNDVGVRRGKEEKKKKSQFTRGWVLRGGEKRVAGKILWEI